MDELERLVRNAEALVAEGYYDVTTRSPSSPSFLEPLGSPDLASRIIAEIKFASPTMTSGKPTAAFDDILRAFVATGPLGLSVLAEPRIFGGHLDFVRRASGQGLPVLMKDVVVDPVQVDAAAACGASAILLIQAIDSKGLLGYPIQTLIDAAHEGDLDVVLEVHTPDEWEAASSTDADIFGINHRDLSTMEIDLSTTSRLLSSHAKDRPVIAMSGVERRDQVTALLRAGADAVLVGTSVMAASDPAKKLEELLHG